MNSIFKNTIYKKVLDFGGIKRVADPENPYLPQNPKNRQMSLFENKHENDVPKKN
jgi:hypothetical protein